MRKSVTPTSIITLTKADSLRRDSHMVHATIELAGGVLVTGRVGFPTDGSRTMACAAAYPAHQPTKNARLLSIDIIWSANSFSSSVIGTANSLKEFALQMMSKRASARS